MSENILSYPVVISDKSACVSQIFDWLEYDELAKYFVCTNPHSIQVAETDSLFKEALQQADLATPDGVGIVIASKIFGGGIKDRVTGSDVFLGLSEVLNKKGTGSYFFLGSTESVLEQIREKIAVEYPRIKVVGTYSPPFKSVFSDDDNQKMIEAINSVSPDVLWVGMTAPKQEKWIYQHRGQLNVKFIGAVGAVFDFYTGNVKRSHPFFLKMGLEWLPRLLQEPRRLWQRNFISNPMFMMRVIRKKFLG
ncbi:MAG: WecB/TagA/CpsF family glycosyltransferase [Gammaproteobacteria bacterium]|nr:WecB/TagA/CpsF family glycosyltransferase [Gammaproteobacteria bacterium]